MNLEDIVASRELSERLRELDFPQEGTLFTWAFNIKEKRWVLLEHQIFQDVIEELRDFSCIDYSNPIAAPTAEELLKYFPDEIIEVNKHKEKCAYHLSVKKFFKNGNLSINYEGRFMYNGFPHSLVLFWPGAYKKMADGLAEILILLIENGYVRFDVK